MKSFKHKDEVEENGRVSSESDSVYEHEKYLLQEANLIGNRIQWYLEQHEKIETLGLFSTGTVWAFLLTQTWNEALIYIAWIPFGITLVLFTKSFLFTKTIGEAFQYLYELETEYKLPKGKGWVHYFRSKSSKYKRKWRYSFWTILLIFNFLVPLLFPFKSVLHVVIK